MIGFENKQGEKFYFSSSCTINIGRKTDCDLVINKDSSVSRKHSILKIKFDSAIGKFKTILEDVSKFGVSVNGKEITKLNHKKVELRDGDTIKFGRNESIFKYFCKTIVCTVTGFFDMEKKKIRDRLKKIGIVYSSMWTESVNFLIINPEKKEKTVNHEKVLKALVSSKWIVSPKFLERLEELFKEKNIQKEYPSFSDFPEELSLKSLGIVPGDFSSHPNERRKSIFQSKTFVFFDKKNYENKKEVIEMGGGEVVFIDSKKLKVNRKFMVTHKTHTIMRATNKKKKMKALEEMGFQLFEDINIVIAICLVEPNKVLPNSFPKITKVPKTKENVIEIENIEPKKKKTPKKVEKKKRKPIGKVIVSSMTMKEYDPFEFVPNTLSNNVDDDISDDEEIEEKPKRKKKKNDEEQDFADLSGSESDTLKPEMEMIDEEIKRKKKKKEKRFVKKQEKTPGRKRKKKIVYETYKIGFEKLVNSNSNDDFYYKINKANDEESELNSINFKSFKKGTNEEQEETIELKKYHPNIEVSNELKTTIQQEREAELLFNEKGDRIISKRKRKSTSTKKKKRRKK